MKKGQTETSIKLDYLKKICQEAGFDPASREGRIIESLLDAMASMAQDMARQKRRIDELESEVELMDEELSDLEDEVYFDDEAFENAMAGEFPDDDEDDEEVLKRKIMETLAQESIEEALQETLDEARDDDDTADSTQEQYVYPFENYEDDEEDEEDDGEYEEYYDEDEDDDLEGLEDDLKLVDRDCPMCGGPISITVGMLRDPDGVIYCPNCGGKILLSKNKSE